MIELIGENMTNKEYMQNAIKEAGKGIRSGHGGPFGAVVVKNGKVIGKGHNMVLKNNDPTCHGEVSAIRDACKNLKSFDLSGACIYTTSEPCPMCLGAVLWANIDTIYYGCTIKDNDLIGFRDEKFYNKLSMSTGKMKANMKQVCYRECLKLFEEYNSIKNKRMY